MKKILCAFLLVGGMVMLGGGCSQKNTPANEPMNNGPRVPPGVSATPTPTSDTSGTDVSAAQRSSGTHVIIIKYFKFHPELLTVRVGDTV